jgi:hydrogenase/urease accessory protein HupE
MLQHGVEHGQQFPHAGGERHFLGFAHSTQALIERLDSWVARESKGVVA